MRQDARPMKRFDSQLATLRDRVDAIDTQLLALLNARAAVVGDIYTLKEQHGTPRFNRARTEAILERLVRLNRGPLSTQDMHELFTPILEFFVERYQAGEDTLPADASR